MHATRGRGRGRPSNRGRGGRIANHRDNRKDSEYEEKY